MYLSIKAIIVFRNHIFQIVVFKKQSDIQICIFFSVIIVSFICILVHINTFSYFWFFAMYHCFILFIIIIIIAA